MTVEAATAPSPLPDLHAGGGASQWRCAVPAYLCVGRAPYQFLFGGTALAACLDAMERTLEQPVSFASAQFLSYARPGEDLALAVDVVADGKAIKQVRAVATVQDRVILTVQAALGRRSDPLVQESVAMPAVPPPQDCPARSVARLLSSNMHDLVELRLAAGQLPGREPWGGPVPGPLLFWARARDGSTLSRQHLAIMADFFSIGIPAALGRDASGSSLDNHIRFIAPPQGQWALCEVEIAVVRDGLVHGTMRQFGQDGRLLALAGQSMILRRHDQE